jgi:hypothetical protein
MNPTNSLSIGALIAIACGRREPNRYQRRVDRAVEKAMHPASREIKALAQAKRQRKNAKRLEIAARGA